MTIIKYKLFIDDELICYFESNKVFTSYSKIRLGDGTDMQYIVFNDNKILGGNKNGK